MKLAFNGCNAPSFTSSEAYNSLYYSALGICPFPGADGAPQVQHHLLLQQLCGGREGTAPEPSLQRGSGFPCSPLSYEWLSTQHGSGIKSVVLNASQRKLSRSDSPRYSSSSGGATSAKKIGAEEVR